MNWKDKKRLKEARHGEQRPAEQWFREKSRQKLLKTPPPPMVE
jgi:hypothetical protein